LLNGSLLSHGSFVLTTQLTACDLTSDWCGTRSANISPTTNFKLLRSGNNLSHTRKYTYGLTIAAGQYSIPSLQYSMVPSCQFWVCCSILYTTEQKLSDVEATWNVMAHAQKPDFIFRRNGQVHLDWRRRQFNRLLAAEVCASAVVMLDTPCSEVVWRVLAMHSICQFPFTSPPMHRVPSHINWNLHILHPSHFKFYKRVHAKNITAGLTFIAAKHLSVFLKPCSEQVPKN
jgi:hypothetical protein